MINWIDRDSLYHNKCGGICDNTCTCWKLILFVSLWLCSSEVVHYCVLKLPEYPKVWEGREGGREGGGREGVGGGSGRLTHSLHRLFRRGSRAGVSEEDPGNPFSPPTGGSLSKQQIFTQSLDTATLSDQLLRRGSAPPTSPIQVMTLSDEERETEDALNKYDFLDLMTESTTDRMDQQRSPLPPSLSQKRQGQKTQTIPRYFLSFIERLSSIWESNCEYHNSLYWRSSTLHFSGFAKFVLFNCMVWRDVS